MFFSKGMIILKLFALCCVTCYVVSAWKIQQQQRPQPSVLKNRRDFVKSSVVALPSAALLLLLGGGTESAGAADENALNVDDFLKTGMVAQPMGVSGQAGKSRPETGVILRDDVSQDSRTGDVLAEILVEGNSGKKKMAVTTTFVSPWSLAKGTVFDVECRDAKTGDGVFLQVSAPTKGSTASMDTIKDSFLLDTLLSKTGRFSFYGQPTDVKIRQAKTIQKGNDTYRVLDLSFATISQATQTELPRRARLVATIPSGSNQIVMLIASCTEVRWKNKGTDQVIAKIMDSFRVTPSSSISG